MKHLTIKDIINRKIQHINSRSPEEQLEFKYYDKGSLRAYKDILIDIDSLEEDEFVKKYIGFIQKNKEKKFKLEEGLEEIEEFDGYNNFVVFVLMLLNPIYEYDLDD
ncbi:hypothetical protein [Kurthia huakuii]|uniref:hypothetical protein n=1 Tax=Kurthia huakuii TaxID=1421019 RepID=UPI000496B481|nr:hypothetical protein [Kurthia huakuii]MBM7698700.1 hypothetical protein [Kurthia huakuii]